jgi:hypothetical protein
MMTSTPRPMVRPDAPAPAAGTKPAAPAPEGKNDKRRLALVMACIAGLVIVVATVAFFARPRNQVPLLNADTVTLVKFVASDGYGKLGFSQQRQFMGVLEDRDDNDELKNAFNAGQINEKEYRAALLEAWVGEQLKRSEKYGRTSGEEAKQKYLQELVARKQKNKTVKPKTEDANDRTAGIKRDSTLEDARMANLPPEVREQWQKFKAAQSAFKEARERVAETKATP